MDPDEGRCVVASKNTIRSEKKIHDYEHEIVGKVLIRRVAGRKKGSNFAIHK
jgi:hypothetical protein